MYRSCIFCSAPLGSNESIERFPVGRSLAFDGEKGRLWAVCGRCARWNLAPLEERWEAIDEVERLFRDTRLRVQSENIGLARLRDGTRLIRVGQALPGELALWRYGARIARRQPRFPRLRAHGRRVSEQLLTLGGKPLLLWGMFLFAPVVPTTIGAASAVWSGVSGFRYWRADRRIVHVTAAPAGEQPVIIRREDLDGARISHPDDGRGLQLLLPYSGPGGRCGDWGRYSRILRGTEAQSVLSRLIVFVNEHGASRATVNEGVALIASAESPDAFVRTVAREGHVLAHDRRVMVDGSRLLPPVALALEMALHEETERRALDGELAMLEGMWRQAEEIAAIADRLPDLPAPEPPRLASKG